MGWSFRKSFKLGPVRVNLSKSGLGFSAGVKGFRTGVNARGNRYTSVSIPGTGIRHTSTASSGARAQSESDDESPGVIATLFGFVLAIGFLGILALVGLAALSFVVSLASSPTVPNQGHDARVTAPVTTLPFPTPPATSNFVPTRHELPKSSPAVAKSVELPTASSALIGETKSPEESDSLGPMHVGHKNQNRDGKSLPDEAQEMPTKGHTTIAARIEYSKDLSRQGKPLYQMRKWLFTDGTSIEGALKSFGAGKVKFDVAGQIKEFASSTLSPADQKFITDNLH